MVIYMNILRLYLCESRVSDGENWINALLWAWAGAATGAGAATSAGADSQLPPPGFVRFTTTGLLRMKTLCTATVSQ